MANDYRLTLSFIDADGWTAAISFDDDSPAALMQRAEKAKAYLKTQGCHSTAALAGPQTAAPAAPAALAGPQTAAPAAPIPAAPNGAQTPNTSRSPQPCNLVTVTKTASGKTQLQFQTAELGALKCTLPPEQMLQILPDGWTLQHLAPGARYDVNLLVHWRPAGQYKNVVKVENA